MRSGVVVLQNKKVVVRLKSWDDDRCKDLINVGLCIHPVMEHVQLCSVVETDPSPHMNTSTPETVMLNDASIRITFSCPSPDSNAAISYRHRESAFICKQDTIPLKSCDPMVGSCPLQASQTALSCQWRANIRSSCLKSCSGQAVSYSIWGNRPTSSSKSPGSFTCR